AVFFLLSILCFLRWLSAGPARRRAYVGALLCAVLAILSKPSTVMLPVALALCTWWLQGGIGRRALLALAPFFALAAVAAGWTIWEQKYHSGAVGAAWAQTWPERAIIAGRASWFYLGKLLWPEPLVFIYPRWNVDARTALSFVAPGAVLVL